MAGRNDKIENNGNDDDDTEGQGRDEKTPDTTSLKSQGSQEVKIESGKNITGQAKKDEGGNQNSVIKASTNSNGTTNVNIRIHPTPFESDSASLRTQGLFMSSEKDLEILRVIRKVTVKREPSNGNYCVAVASESSEPYQLYTTKFQESERTLWTKLCSPRSNKVLYIKNEQNKGIMKVEFGRSRNLACCETLKYATMTAHFESSNEEPLSVIFKDRGCCLSSCCWSSLMYECVPQSDIIQPFTVCSKRHRRKTAELMVKHGDGSILAFIDKEDSCYTVTMGENLQPTMKACLIGFVITMDVLDREDTTGITCSIQPSTYVTFLFLILLFMMIGAFLYHFITSMVLSWPNHDKPDSKGCSDAVHKEMEDEFLIFT